MSKEDQQYQDWLKEVENKLPADAVENFKAITAHPEAKEIFRGGLRHQDYSRRVNEVQKEREKLQAWFEEEAPKNQRLVSQVKDYEAKLVEYQRTLQELGIEANSHTVVNPSGVQKEDLEGIRKEFDAKVQMLDRALPRFLGDVASVLHQANKDNFNIDPREVINYAAENAINPLQAYAALTSTQRETRAVEARKAEEVKWREEGAREALSKLPSSTYIRPSGPTVVDTLTNKDFASDSRSRVSSAVKDFLEGDFKSSGSGLF